LKTEWDTYSVRKEQGNIILLRHYGEDSSKYIHQKGDVSHAQTDRQMCKTICKWYIRVMCVTAYTNIRPVQFLLLEMLFAQDHPPLV
jgi:hypothetical protein